MKVLLTGGGTGGHVVPNIAVIEELRKNADNNAETLEILYVGSKGGIEKKMIEKHNVNIVCIYCGKLRRYFSLDNFLDFFKVPVGIFQAYKILKKFKPDVVFSKGGYVSLPVSIAAGMLKIPLLVHESDLNPGLANKLSFRFASKILLSFEESKSFIESIAGIDENNIIVTGNPIRKINFEGDADRGRRIVNGHKPIIFIMGGSLGANQINQLVWGCLKEILEDFDVIHQVGKGNLNSQIAYDGYKQFEFINEELPDIYAACDMIVSRGGANSLFEIALLKKKALIIPLSNESSRGDQVENANVFVEKIGFSMLTGEINSSDFLLKIKETMDSKISEYDGFKNGVDQIVEIINSYK